MKKVVLFICVLFSIYSCNTKKKESPLDKVGLNTVIKKKESDLDKMGLKGNVIFVMPYVWSITNTILEFDNNGNLIRTISIFDFENKILQSETSIIRDSSNKIIGENSFTYSNEADKRYYARRSKYNYVNNKLSTITYETRDDDYIEKYKYEDDKLVEMKQERHAKSKNQQSSLIIIILITFLIQQ